MKQKEKKNKTVEEFLDENVENILKSRCLDENGFKRLCRVILELAFIRGCRETDKEAIGIVRKGDNKNGESVKD